MGRIVVVGALVASIVVAATAFAAQEASVRLRIYDPKGVTSAEVTTADIVRSSVHATTFNGSGTLFFRLTRRGAAKFHALTHTLARRGARLGRPQRFFVAIDGRIGARNFVDYGAYPNGLSGRSGILIEGMDPRMARDIARRIRQT